MFSLDIVLLKFNLKSTWKENISMKTNDLLKKESIKKKERNGMLCIHVRYRKKAPLIYLIILKVKLLGWVAVFMIITLHLVF